METTTAPPPTALTLPVFLTAYDPAELPGGTLDPLGLTGGYLALADDLFPGMTAAANQGTYLGVLCAALHVAEQHGKPGGLSSSSARSARIDMALRFERLWALSCALKAAESPRDQETPPPDDAPQRERVPGLRGITYVNRVVERLHQESSKAVRTDFPLLAQQYRYGMFGIYGGVAEEFELLDKSTLSLRPGLGQGLGAAFFEGTTKNLGRGSSALLKATLDPGATIRVDVLRAWSERTFAGLEFPLEARRPLREAILASPRRANMFRLLEDVWEEWEGGWSDIDLLSACEERLREANGDERLLLALGAARAYDAFLRGFTLLFERVLWRCRRSGDAEAAERLYRDPVLCEASEALPELARGLLQAQANLLEGGIRSLEERGRGILQAVRRAADVEGPDAAVELVLRRHGQVQRDKVEQGRPKQPWVERRGTDWTLTSGRIGGRSSEVKGPQDVRGPDWRVGAAVSFLSVSGGLGKGARS